jgi:hypothetical protein
MDLEAGRVGHVDVEMSSWARVAWRCTRGSGSSPYLGINYISGLVHGEPTQGHPLQRADGFGC